MKPYIRLALALALLISSTIIVPPAAAISKNEIDTSYYDACMEPMYEHVIGCYGEVYTWGTSSAGSTYKNVVSIECEGSGYYSRWYVRNSSGGWTLLPAIPQPGC